jgi:hypothetical protein
MLQRTLVTLALAACGLGALALSRPARHSGPTVAALDVVYDGQFAAEAQPGDSAFSREATRQLREALSGARIALTDSAVGATAVRDLGEPPLRCQESVRCLGEIGQQLRARWVVAATLRKVSRLIWHYRTRVVDVERGTLALDDEIELKGPLESTMTPGTRWLARRIASAVGGETTARAAPAH